MARHHAICLAWLAVVACGSLSSFEANAESPREVEAPCARAGTEDRYPERRPCHAVIEEAKAKVELRVRQQAEHYYSGCDLDPTAPPTVGGCRGTRIPTPTCNVLDTEGVPKTFNLIMERDQNHEGALPGLARASGSCGNWPRFQTQVRGRSCQVTPIYAGQNVIEDAYNRGAWIQALNCFHHQVRSEIERGTLKISRLTLPDGTQAEGACASMAREYAGTVTRNGEVTQSISQKLGAQPNLGDIDHCTGSERARATGESADVGPLRQSACFLSSARQSTEAMFMHLAACEIWNRARRSYEVFLGTALGRDDVRMNARNQVQGRRGSRSECNEEHILNTAYKPAFFSGFRRKAEGLWNAESCQGGAP